MSDRLSVSSILTGYVDTVMLFIVAYFTFIISIFHLTLTPLAHEIQKMFLIAENNRAISMSQKSEVPDYNL